jgi:hypothetical protein
MCRRHVGENAAAAAVPAGWSDKRVWNEIGVGSGGVAVTFVPRDIAESGNWEVIVAGVEKVVTREAGRHTLKVVERRDERTGVVWRRKVVSSSTSAWVCV